MYPSLLQQNLTMFFKYTFTLSTYKTVTDSNRINATEVLLNDSLI